MTNCLIRLVVVPGCLIAGATLVRADEPLRSLAPQAVSAVDLSADGQVITVGTMAFGHEANLWQFAADGSVLSQRRFPPFAPMQVATLAGGKAMAIGLAYSRVTSPEPTVWLGPTESLLSGSLKDEFVEADSRDSELARSRSAELTLTWLMPMLTDYGIFPPRRVDDPLPLHRVGDEAEFTVAGQKFRAIFVPGHSFDLTVYLTELAGKRIAFTGDLGFENQDILHRGWDDDAKARAVLPVIRDQVLVWKPDIVFTGHGVRTNGTEFLTKLVEHTERSLDNP